MSSLFYAKQSLTLCPKLVRRLNTDIKPLLPQALPEIQPATTNSTFLRKATFWGRNSRPWVAIYGQDLIRILYQVEQYCCELWQYLRDTDATSSRVLPRV